MDSSPPGIKPNNRYEVQWENLVFQQNRLVDQQTKIFLHILDTTKGLEEKVDKSAQDHDLLNKEVEMWKRAYIQEQQESHRAKEDAHRLRKQLEEFQEPKDRDSIVLALIDGDGYIFKDELLKRGLEGGREAAQMLNENIMAQLDKDDKSGPRVQLWTYIFSNLKGLQQTLVGCNVCTSVDFEAFVMGFNQANPRFTINNVHTGKEAADAKIRAYLQTWTRFPQTLKVFFGGGHDNGYHPTLAELQSDGLLEKIVLLQGYDQVAAEIRSFHLPVLASKDLFRPEKLSPQAVVTKRISPPPSIVGSPNPSQVNVTQVGSPKPSYTNVVEASRPTPQAIARSATASLTNSRRRLPNPNLELHKNNPPPCNLFYLSQCNRGAECKYSHEYTLNAEQYATLRENARKSPCPAVNIDSPCPFGEKCALGHKCPNGPQCFHRKLDKCWFRGKMMHNVN